MITEPLNINDPRVSNDPCYQQRRLRLLVVP
jgi:hypothetical protein